MAKVLCVLVVSALLSLFHGFTTATVKTEDGSEEWGYVEVRPRAHMFWWLYRSPYRVNDPSRPWPVILWLQGGPGASGVGIGNFQEIGPLDSNLKPRNSTWLRVADLLFVDNPVGTGFSFVEDASNDKLLVKTDEEAADDLTTLLIMIFNRDEGLQKSPLYIVAESYGGKFAVTLALAALDAIEAGKLKLTLGGVALGDSWISPEDFVFSWAPLLKDLSRLDTNGAKKSMSVAEKIRDELIHGKYVEATTSWRELEEVISQSSNLVDFYNVLLDAFMDPVSSVAAEELGNAIAAQRYSTYLNYLKSSSSSPGSDGDINSLMEGPIRKKLKIIPKNVTWGGQGNAVFNNFQGDFMKPRINEVDELLAKGVNVTVYNGQVGRAARIFGYGQDAIVLWDVQIGHERFHKVV
ncbi:serine carboxypeptidase-like 51 isoform X2 [Punica granatum]|uniref:Carboxypeptidase n=1 Tax=Punica granatum TaxID=22663 RepID=A0A6P8CW57_PUNGR|nr:serine carboxypeptidase-like 51 isoform X2 [Punica granatum]